MFSWHISIWLLTWCCQFCFMLVAAKYTKHLQNSGRQPGQPFVSWRLYESRNHTKFINPYKSQEKYDNLMDLAPGHSDNPGQDYYVIRRKSSDESTNRQRRRHLHGRPLDVFDWVSAADCPRITDAFQSRSGWPVVQKVESGFKTFLKIISAVSTYWQVTNNLKKISATLNTSKPSRVCANRSRYGNGAVFRIWCGC